jgi:hypothetical protein
MFPRMPYRVPAFAGLSANAMLPAPEPTMIASQGSFVAGKSPSVLRTSIATKLHIAKQSDACSIPCRYRHHRASIFSGDCGSRR